MGNVYCCSKIDPAQFEEQQRNAERKGLSKRSSEMTKDSQDPSMNSYRAGNSITQKNQKLRRNKQMAGFNRGEDEELRFEGEEESKDDAGFRGSEEDSDS